MRSFPEASPIKHNTPTMDKQQDRGSTDRQIRYSGVHPTQQQPNHHELERLNLDDRRTPAPSTPPSTASSHGNASDENQPDGGFHLLVGNNEQHLRAHGYFGDHDARIILRFNSSHIPGKPGSRHIVLITTFFEDKVGRQYSDDNDYVHLPSAIFEPNAKCWMIIDLSVKQRQTLDNVPLFCYRVRTSNDGASVYVPILC